MSEPAAKRSKTCYNGSDIEKECIDTTRAFSADMVQAAKSGHPGAPMGCAPMAHLLWGEVMNYSPSDPKWMNRDRFILSNGHACALQYSMLHFTGYDVSLEDCQKFRQLGSKTPGHPESFVTSGVEVCTGPLGQGITNAVGIAIAEKHMASTFNKDDAAVFDHFTYVICGDGCLQEGISSEASSLAGHLGLGKLIVLYDDNLITIDGSTELSFTEDVNKRYESYGWDVQTVDDVSNGLEALRTAVETAKGVTDKPSIIKIRTVIGYGSTKEGTAKTHGAPLGPEDLEGVKTRFGLDPEKHFQVSDAVKSFWTERVASVEKKKEEWVAMYAKYKEANPDQAKELDRRFAGELLPIEELEKVMPTFATGDKDKATRQFSEICLNAVAPILPELIGGSADLTPSNLTAIKCSGDFQKTTPAGRYLRFGVREHAMSSICNGIFAYGGFRPFCATFLNFAGYALGAIRLSALSRFGVIYIMTHDSIGLGEDGPTHQPVEMLESLRSMPNIYVHRPGDSNETVAAYMQALQHRESPSVICGSRSGVKFLGNTVENALKGGYIVHDTEGEPELVLIGSGTEISLCVDAAKKLTEDGTATRAVSMPCQEVFLEQSSEYQKSVLPGSVPTLSVEASSVHGWHRFSHAQISMTRYGASGKGPEVMAKFGFTVENVVEKATKLKAFYNGKDVPDLMNRPDFETAAENDDH